MDINNFYNIKKQVEEACLSCGRDPSEVTLIAVSKTKPVSDILEVRGTGHLDFGENKVQEMTAKQEEIGDPSIRWHLIGHLQKNKVKYIAGKTFLIHSVDSFELAEKIQTECEKKDVHADILLEVNVAQEDSKFGITCEAAPELARRISELSRVHIKGLMTIAPYTDDAETNRPYFRKLRQLAVDIKSRNYDNIDMNILSMGMSGDFTVAISKVLRWSESGLRYSAKEIMQFDFKRMEISIRWAKH